jgi:putative nucleotidyltransferase with HDIG domain
MNMYNLDQPVNLKLALAKLDTLPAMPAIAQKLLGLQLDTDQGEAEFLRLIEQDPQISAKILGLANTAVYGASRKVMSLSDAVMLMGMTRVKSVAIGIAATSTLAKVPEGKLKSTEIWMHSMAIAMGMSTIARAMPAHSRPQEDVIFFAGLLHDIGYMALSYMDIKTSDLLHGQLQQASGSMLLSIEKELLGMTHGEIGAELARHWGLPEEIIAVIRDHHGYGETDTRAYPPLVRLVNIAEKILGEFGVNKPSEQVIADSEWLDLGIDPEKADDLCDRVCEVATQAGQMASAF